MTEVAFHFNAPDKLGYVCRFVRKALRHGAQVTVTAPPGVLAHLSARLWKSAPSDFLAHAAPGADAQVLALSPVVLVVLATASPHRDILLNLDEAVPEGLEGFARVVEVVSLDDMDRAMARNRWKDYAARGFAIQRHDLVLKGM